MRILILEMATLIQIIELKVNGRNRFREWLSELTCIQRAIVEERLERVRFGNLGQYRDLRGGLFELKFGSGLRVYYGLEGKTMVLLICGGDKGSQVRDIETARAIWSAYRKGSS